MTTWFTSDLHLGHANIISYTGRPFVDVDAMNRGIVERWNERVADSDDVWVLGDVVMGKAAETLGLIELLHGTLTLVVGNHDRLFAPGNGRDTWISRYSEAGFSTIIDGSTSIELAGRSVTVCHFPYRGDSRDEERYSAHRPGDDGKFLLHGHTHGRWRQHGRMIDVGLDAWGGAPVSTDTLAELISAGPNELDPLPWDGVTPGGPAEQVRSAR